MVFLNYFLFYLYSFLGIIISFQFRKYTVNDYRYNAKLIWKRRISLIYSYIVTISHGVLLSKGGDISKYNSDYNFLIWSTFVLFFIDFFAIWWVEYPKEFNKKKKWK